MADKQTTKPETTGRRRQRDPVSAVKREAAATAQSGAKHFASADRSFETAQGLTSASFQVSASAIRDATRADDVAVMAKRIGQLGEIVGDAGARDAAEGIAMLVASDNIEAISAMVGMMSVADLERGMELARLSGEMRVAGQIVTRLKMPVLAAFLGDRSERLNNCAINDVVRSSATRVVATALIATGADIRGLSEQEIAEGVVRMALESAMTERADDLAADAALQSVQSKDKLAAAEELGSAARAAAREGVAQTAIGGAELGAAAVMTTVAEGMEQKQASA